MAPVRTAQRFARWSRLAAIGAIPVMGALLVLVIWSTLTSVRAATETSDRGEADALHAELRAAIFADADELDLATRVERARAEFPHVTYLAVVDAGGTIAAASGEAAASPLALRTWLRAARAGVPETIDDRVRVVYKRPARRGRRARPANGILIEFVPVVSPDLRTTARWLAVVGGIAALTLTVLAGVLVRWSFGRERAVREAEQARRLATLGQMSAVLAHEIRNPLASLKGNAQLLAGGLPDGDRMRAKADRVVAEATRLETLSNDLLEFVRDGELRLAEHDPAAVVRDAAAAAAEGRVTVDATAAPRAWRFDADKLRQVLINLFENAAELDGGPIEARVTRADRGLAIEVRDHGPGIAEPDLPHLFEPFFTRRTRGTGLGLAVAKRLVDLHGGTIEADNAPDGGARFRITLPRR